MCVCVCLGMCHHGFELAIFGSLQHSTGHLAFGLPAQNIRKVPKWGSAKLVI